MKAYFVLTKPGIVFGNAITFTGGFTLASKGNFNASLFLATLFGLCFIVASACVCNNYIDREKDKKMLRTKNRPLVTGKISKRQALIFAISLGCIGALILFLFSNALTLLIALMGFIVYVLLYSFLKYRSLYGTAIGSVAGAAPPLVGYCAVTCKLDMAALLIFAIVALWQMPHFFAITLYRLADYSAGAIPVLPLKKGLFITKIRMVFYVVAFTLTALLLTLFGYTGYCYFCVMALIGLCWFLLCLKGFRKGDDTRWAYKMFRFSLLAISVFCFMISVDQV